MDQLVRGTAQGHQIRVIAANTTELVNEACKKHMTSPVVSAALGRLLTAGILMGATMKNDQDLLTLQIQGDGPMRGLLVTADSKGHVKGYPYMNQVELPLKESGKLDVSGAIGKGLLKVVKDIGLKEPFAGQTELVSGEIAEDLTHYYFYSEQTPSIIALGVLVDKDLSIKHSGGIMIQLMPSAEESLIRKLEKQMGLVQSVTSFMETSDQVDDLIAHYLGDIEFLRMDSYKPSFICDCSKERVTRALISLGKTELKDLIAEDKPVEMSCNFCNKPYKFELEDLQEIVDKL